MNMLCPQGALVAQRWFLLLHQSIESAHSEPVFTKPLFLYYWQADLPTHHKRSILVCRFAAQAHHGSPEHTALLDALGSWTEQDPLDIVLPSGVDGAIMKQGLLGAMQ